MVRFLVFVFSHFLALLMAPFYGLASAFVVARSAYRHCQESGGFERPLGGLRFVLVACVAVPWYAGQVMLLVLLDGPTHLTESFYEAFANKSGD